MFPVRWIVAVVAVLAGFQMTAPPGVAGESGTLSFVRTYVKDYTTIEYAGTSVTGGTLEGVVSIVESSGGPFVAGARERVTCVVLAKRSDAGVDLESSCTATGESGDQWYTLSKRSSGGVESGGGGPGTLEIAGGTGAYEGVTGRCDYDVSYLADGWVSMTTHCTWQR